VPLTYSPLDNPHSQLCRKVDEKDMQHFVGVGLGVLAEVRVVWYGEKWLSRQSLAATNRVTEQLNWLSVESFYMSCSISWMASLIDNLYLLNLIVLVINWQHVSILRGTIRVDPQETLYWEGSPTEIARLVLLIIVRLWSKKGLQGGKTIQQRSGFATLWSLMLLPLLWLMPLRSLHTRMCVY